MRAASVVIPTYNREQQLVETIEYVLATPYPDFEVIVVDQTDEHTPEVAAALEEFQHDDRLTYIQLPIANLPLARNVGLNEAQGDVIIYVDDDVELDPDFVAAHVKRYADASVGAVAGRIITPNVGPDENSSGALAGRPRPGRLRVDGNHESHFNQTAYTGDVEWGQGCNMSFRRTALVESGAFDERFTGNAFHEEVDAFVRVRDQGYRAVFEPEARLVHLKEATGGCRSQQDQVEYLCTVYRNQSLFYFKNQGWTGWMRYTRHRFLAMYSAMRIHDLPITALGRFMQAHGMGVRAAYRDDPRGLTRQLRHQQTFPGPTEQTSVSEVAA